MLPVGPWTTICTRSSEDLLCGTSVSSFRILIFLLGTQLPLTHWTNDITSICLWMTGLFCHLETTLLLKTVFTVLKKTAKLPLLSPSKWGKQRQKLPFTDHSGLLFVLFAVGQLTLTSLCHTPIIGRPMDQPLLTHNPAAGYNTLLVWTQKYNEQGDD